jgi:AcrR family transcriptional regulator
LILYPKRMSKPRTESPEIRKRQILDAARVLLSQKSFEDIRMEDVSRRAELAKGTLYLYFRDKSQIMVAVHADLLSELELSLRELDAHEGRELLRQTVKMLLGFLKKNHDFFFQFFQTKSTFSGPDQAAVVKRFQKHMDVIKTLILKASEKGEFPPPQGYIGTLFFMSLIRMFWEKTQILPEKNTPGDVDTIVDLFLHGIQSQSAKGKKA